MTDKWLLTALACAVALVPESAIAAKKKTKKYEKQEVKIEIAPVQPQPDTVRITNAAKQLYGEWTIESVRGKKVTTTERPYIYLDFKIGSVYGNNGCNAINGNFKLNGDKLKFGDMIQTNKSCRNVTSERTVMRAIAEADRFMVTRLFNVDRMTIYNQRGAAVMQLKRQNLDLLNGPWVVKELNGVNVTDKNVRLVIDIQMLTVNATSGCNIINGVVNIDPSKDFAVQFEDLKSSNNVCPNIETETKVLLALEETDTYKRINDNEMALLNRQGEIVTVLHRIDLRKDAKQQ